jgi:hypothetical protein
MSENTDHNNDLELEETEQASELKCHCPETYPDWDGKDIDLSHKCVHLLPIPTIFHMPLAFEFYRRKQSQDIENLELPEKWPGFSLTRMGMLRGQMIRILDDIKSPSRYVTYLGRSFIVRAKLHPGDIGTVKTTLGEMQMQMVNDGHRPKELYLGHLTCPACEERKGGPKMLLVRRWIESEGLKKRSQA